MRVKLTSLFTAVTLALALFLSMATHAAPKTPTAATPTTAAPTPNVEPATPPPPHPEIRDAIAALRRAREHMDHAAHDFGGHRVEALRATDEAIRQLEDCLKFDK